MVLKSNQILVIGLLPNIMNSLQYLMMVLVLIVHTKGQQQILHPSSYIWVDFQQQTNIDKNPKVINGSIYFSAKIPCKTRISPNSCTFRYITYPANWKVEPDGTLLVQAKDISSLGAFSVDVDLIDPSEQTFHAKLVLQFKNNMLSTHDRADFFVKNHYKSQNEVANQRSKYQESRLIKQVPNGFINFIDAQKIISTLDQRQIQNFVNDILKQSPPCVSFKRYLTRISDIFKTYIKKVNLVGEEELKKQQKAEDALSTLMFKRIQLRKKNNIDQDTDIIQQKIGLCRQQMEYYVDDKLKYDQEKQQRQFNMRAPIKVSTDPEMMVSGLEPKTFNKLKQQMDKTASWLVSALVNRQILFDAVSELKFRLESSTVAPNQQAAVKAIKQKYRANQRLLFNQQIKYLLKQQSLKCRSGYLPSIAYKLKKANEKMLKSGTEFMNPDLQQFKLKKKKDLQYQNELIQTIIRQFGEKASQLAGQCNK